MKRTALGMSFAIVLPLEALEEAHALIRNTLKDYSAYDGDGSWTDSNGKRHHERHTRYESTLTCKPPSYVHNLAMKVLKESGEQAVYYVVDGEPFLIEREDLTVGDLIREKYGTESDKAPDTVRSEPHPDVASEPVSVEEVEPIDVNASHFFPCDFGQTIECKRRVVLNNGAWFTIGEITRALPPEGCRKLARLLLAIAESD